MSCSNQTLSFALDRSQGPYSRREHIRGPAVSSSSMLYYATYADNALHCLYMAHIESMRTNNFHLPHHHYPSEVYRNGKLTSYIYTFFCLAIARCFNANLESVQGLFSIYVHKIS